MRIDVAPRLAKVTPFYYGWVILFAAGTSLFVRNAAASLTISVFIFPISEELGWSRTLIAGAASAGGLAASGASPLVGWLSDRYGVRIVLATSVLALGLSTISLAWATVPIAFYLAYGTSRVIFSSPTQIGASVVVSRWFVRLRGRATGILFMAHSAGMALFPLIAGIIIEARGWRDAWIFLGILVWAVALGPVWLLIIQRPEDVGMRPDGDKAPPDDASNQPAAPRQAEATWTLREAMRTPALWMLASAAGALFLVQAGTNTHQGAFFRDEGLSVALAASAVSLNAIFAGVGSVFWGWVAEKFAVRYVFAAVALVMATASILFTTVSTTAEAFAYAALFGFALGGILVVPPVAFANYFGRRSLGAIRGVTEPFTSLGQAIGALAAGAVFDLTDSYRLAFISFAVIGLATIFLLLLTKPPRHATDAIHSESII